MGPSRKGPSGRPAAWFIPTVAALTVGAALVGVMLAARTPARASGLVEPPPATTTAPLAPPVLDPTPSAGASSSAPPVPSHSPTATVTPRPRPASSKPKPKPSPTPSVPATLAGKLHTLPSTTTQVVIVHASSAGTTHATLETFSKVNGVWVKKFAPMAARIGADGFSGHHTEGVPTTPTGVYGFGSTMYGVGANPGVHYAYHQLVTNDWWDENPSSATYNQFVHTSTDPGGGSEALWTITPQYEFFAFIKYNSPPTGDARGSAVFLHEAGSGATAGCVSLPRSDLLDVLRWLNPSANPRIVLGTDSDLSHF